MYDYAYGEHISLEKMNKPEKGANLEGVHKDKQNIVYVYVRFAKKIQKKIKKNCTKCSCNCTKHI